MLLIAGMLPLAYGASAEGHGGEDVRESVVLVICGNQQGSGAYLKGGGDYVLTAGHVVRSVDTGDQAETCTVGFGFAPDWKPRSYYRADVSEVVFDDRSDTDFALLRITRHFSGQTALPRPGFAAYEGLAAGDAVTFYGYPSGSDRELKSSVGQVSGFRRGALRASAEIRQGYSGGPVVDTFGRLVGVATRLIFRTDPETGVESVEAYEGADILSIENWLDVFAGGHDAYLEHSDESLVHGAVPPYREEEAACNYLVRTVSNPAVYCLLSGQKRLAFPTSANFFSWFEDFGSVIFVYEDDLAKYRLVSNMTFRAGSFIKIKTDPKVYFVADNLGTIRWVTSEAVAERIAGPDWAALVRDVSDSSFIDYRIGEPIT